MLGVGYIVSAALFSEERLPRGFLSEFEMT
jgi:hypothetical protein